MVNLRIRDNYNNQHSGQNAYTKNNTINKTKHQKYTHIIR